MTVTDTEAAHDLLERTREIVPALRSRVDQTASMRRVPDENVADLRRAGSLKTLQSTRNQGYGLSMRAHLDTVATLARGCASTAWCAGVVHAHSWLLSHFPVEAQDEVYGADPDSFVAAVHRAPRQGHADRRRLRAVGVLGLRLGQRGRRVVAARRCRGRRRRHDDRRGRLPGRLGRRHPPRRLVRERPHRDGVGLGERRQPRRSRPPLPLAGPTRVDRRRARRRRAAGLEPSLRARAGVGVGAHRVGDRRRPPGARGLPRPRARQDDRLHRRRPVLAPPHPHPGRPGGDARPRGRAVAVQLRRRDRRRRARRAHPRLRRLAPACASTPPRGCAAAWRRWRCCSTPVGRRVSARRARSRGRSPTSGRSTSTDCSTWR